jgi:ATP-dependent Clp protease adaptor protein ClpS
MTSENPDILEKSTTNTQEETTEPPDYKVLMHNDDYTTKAFVVELLMAVFKRSPEEANRLMWQVHRNGIGVCGIYPLEVAETKIIQGTTLARENGFPLKLTMEEE